MCGIYGWEAVKGQNFSMYETVVMTTILAGEMEQRGRQSFGAAVWNRDGKEEPEILKGLGCITESSSTLKYTSRADRVLVHTRQATQGAVTIENCHPFLQGNILGVHNGVVFNSDELSEKYSRNFEVDSQHIFAHIDEGLALDELDAYATIVFANRAENYSRLFLARTTSGNVELLKLFRSADKDAKSCGIMWASTSQAAKKAATTAGFFWQVVEIKPQLIYSILDGEIFYTKTEFPVRIQPISQKTSNRWDSTTGVYNGNSSVYVRPKVGGHYTSADFDNSWEFIKENDVYVPKKKGEHAEAQPAGGLMLRAVPENIVDSLKWPRYFTSQNEKILLCDTCGCGVAGHLMGWCESTDDKCAMPTAKSGACFNFGAGSCADCNHFLIDGVHGVYTLTKDGGSKVVVWCRVCGHACDSNIVPDEDGDPDLNDLPPDHHHFI